MYLTIRATDRGWGDLTEAMGKAVKDVGAFSELAEPTKDILLLGRSWNR